MRRRRLVLLVLALLVLLAGGVGLMTLQSTWFSTKVRERIIGEIEKASGGRAEVGAFDFDWKRLTASISGFTIHGTEDPLVAPLLRVKRVVVGLGVTSLLRAGIRVRTIEVNEPAFHITVDASGKTNLPSPKVKQGDKDFLDTILTLAANEITIHNGLFELNERRIPLDLAAKDVDAHLLFNTNRRRPIYYGDVTSKQLRLVMFDLGPMTFGLDSSVALEKGTITVSRARLFTKDSKVDVSGFAYHLHDPLSDFGVSATVSLVEFGGPLRLPIEHKGIAQFAGKVSLDFGARDRKFSYAVEGRVKARGLAVREAPVLIPNMTLDSLVQVTPKGVVARRVAVAALGGEFLGSATLAEFRKLAVNGTFKNLATQTALTATGQKPLPYAATASGTLQLDGELAGKAGVTNTVVKAVIALDGQAAEAAIPIDGVVRLTWNQAARTLELDETNLATPSTSVQTSGTLGQRLNVTARTTRLADFEVLLPEALPIQLKNGSAAFQGAITGPLDNPQIDGQGTLTNVLVQDRLIDSVTAVLSANRDHFEARTLTAAQAPITVEGSATVKLMNWKATNDSPLTAKLTATGATIEKVLADLKLPNIPATGAITIAANLRGSVAALAGEAQVTAENVVAYEEQFQRIRGSVRLTPERMEIVDGAALFHNVEIPFGGTFAAKTGEVAFHTKTTNLDVAQIRNFVKQYPQFKGTITSTLSATGIVANNTFRLTGVERRCLACAT